MKCESIVSHGTQIDNPVIYLFSSFKYPVLDFALELLQYQLHMLSSRCYGNHLSYQH